MISWVNGLHRSRTGSADTSSRRSRRPPLRAADDAVGHHHRSHVVLFEKRQHLLADRHRHTDVLGVGLPSLEGSGFLVLAQDHRRRYLAGEPVVWTVEGDGTDRIAFEPPLCFLLQPFREARSHFKVRAWLDACGACLASEHHASDADPMSRLSALIYRRKKKEGANDA